ncbi:MAG: BamA/TamA family outer membrane protein [Cyclobacteriaceae bacterium]
MHKFVLVVAFSFTSFASFSQEQGLVLKAINTIFNDTSTSAEPKFITYPTLAYAPETRWEIGASGLLVYYANQDKANRLSEVSAFTFVTLERQYGLWLDHALYGDKSIWFFLGRVRLQQFPLLYYGLGPEVTGEELAQIDAGSISIRERMLGKVAGNLYLGLEIDFQRLSNVGFQQLTTEAFESPSGLSPYNTFGLGLGLVYDNRHNVLNVREGFFGEGGFLKYSPGLGSDFDFTSYFLDLRYYYSITDQQVWANQFYLSSINGEAPFNQLSLMGGESLMRGYYLGRYRDNALVAAQTEYRFLPFPFSKRLGASAFIGAGTVASSISQMDMRLLKVAGGAGLRFLLFPGKDIFTRFDVAFSEDGPGYYFFIGEAF